MRIGLAYELLTRQMATLWERSRSCILVEDEERGQRAMDAIVQYPDIDIAASEGESPPPRTPETGSVV
jgi:hypothetical protein